MELLTKSTTIEVIIHPLVLLSVADHYNRVAKDSRNKRVVGVLLGSKTGNSVDVCNSFAVPFEEDASSPKVWFLDHNFLDSMFWMFKKVNCKLIKVKFPTFHFIHLKFFHILSKRKYCWIL
jgi:26S proteasome regulatory subunit N8